MFKKKTERVQSGGKMSKRLVGGIIGCKAKTSLWHLNGFPDRSNIGSTVQYRGETHRYAVYRRSFQHAHFIPIVSVGKREANINWSMVICQGSTRSELP